MKQEQLELKKIAAQLTNIHKSALRYAQSIRSAIAPQPRAFDALRSIRDNAQRAINLGYTVKGEPDLLRWIVLRAGSELAIAETQQAGTAEFPSERSTDTASSGVNESASTTETV